MGRKPRRKDRTIEGDDSISNSEDDNQPSTSRGAREKASASQRARKNYSDNDDSDYEGGNRSAQNTFNTQAQDVDIELLATQLVKYAINHSYRKIPMKRPDVRKHLNIPQKEFPLVFTEAQELLRSTFGLEMVELNESKTSKLIIVYSSIPAVSRLQLNPQEAKEAQLLFIIISYLYMKSVEVHEEHLNHFVAQIGIDVDEYSKAKELFVKQLYLKRTKHEIEGRNETYVTVTWGERAHLEFDKKEMLKTVAQIMGKSMQMFVTQYHETFGDSAVSTQMQESMLVDD